MGGCCGLERATKEAVAVATLGALGPGAGRADVDNGVVKLGVT